MNKVEIQLWEVLLPSHKVFIFTFSQMLKRVRKLTGNALAKALSQMAYCEGARGLLWFVKGQPKPNDVKQ